MSNAAILARKISVCNYILFHGSEAQLLRASRSSGLAIAESAMEEVANQINALHRTLSLVLTRLDALEASAASTTATTTAGRSDEIPEGNNLSSDRREQLSAPVQDSSSNSLPKMISNQKEKLAAIPELKVPEDWPRFLSQLTLIMDAAYPFVADWMHQINVLSDRPNRAVLHRVATGLNLGLELTGLYEQFVLDLWIIFTLMVQGESRSIISLVHTEMKSSEFRTVRGPAAYHELHREHQGRLVDQQILLNRQVHHPERARTVA